MSNNAIANLDSVNFAGQVSISNVSITTAAGNSVNITNLVVGIQYFESMFSPYITGYLIIQDALALNNVLPLQGTELLTLRVKTPGLNSINDLSGTFYLYSVTGREMTTDKSETYSIGFCSREMIISGSKSISQAFSGKIDDLATALITNENYLAATIPVAIDPTLNSVKYISNYWSPVKNLQYLADRAISKYSKAANYVFFANRIGLNFISLSTLYTNAPYQSFFLDKWSKSVLQGASININEQYQRATEFSYEGSSFDYVKSLTDGMLTSTTFSFDVFRKGFITNRYSYINSFGNTPHLNKNPLFGGVGIEPIDSKIYNYTRDYGNFTGFGDSSGENVFQSRHSLLEQLKANVVNIQVPCRTDYTAGQVHKLTKYLSTAISKSTTSVIDRQVSGNYICTGLQHFILPSSGTTILELSRDC